ncbi:hypothetical protein LOK49_LG04G00351 [Camellia lanceoleosa]|uniref:Uncharacterized protein n=1 Tax=Camellia lanceoleosa TaxID=1840588 RepID=A0ACC0HZP1_9ERIC|nr:hypothetical protein LOK49_LG04G00351 [Camellia lanceoleosa]
MRLSSSLIKRLHRTTRSFTTTEGHRLSIVHKRNLDILHDPWFNKGTAFSMTERDRLDLRGLLLQMLCLRNNKLNASVLIAKIEEYAPIVYTPTVGLVCQNYSGLFRRPRGMYFSAAHRGEMMSMVYNWPVDQDGLMCFVKLSGIFGIKFIWDCKKHRLDGEEYIAVLDEFMCSLFEDFQSKWAFKLLQHYRNRYRMFNDDVQGTAGVAIAGLLGAVRAQGKPMIDFPKQKIVVAGAGSAGIGVLNAARKTMARMLGNNESAFDSARSQFWVVDANGLITEERENIDPDALPFARKVNEAGRQGLREGASLVEVVRQVKPDVLLGLSAVGGLFSKEVLEELKCSTSTRPAIFAMLNPTKNAECTPEEAFSILGENIIFASGSPFKDVDLGNGHIGHCNQGNNMYLFPGIGLGTLLSGSRVISDGMLQAAAECLAAYMTEEEVLKGTIYPPISEYVT